MKLNFLVCRGSIDSKTSNCCDFRKCPYIFCKVQQVNVHEIYLTMLKINRNKFEDTICAERKRNEI